MIAFNSVSHAYGEVRSLENIDLQIAAGMSVALIGPSGCGKSTLLKLAAGLLWPAAGQISIAGQTLHAGNVLQMRRRLGYVIQSGGLFPHLSAGDNVTLMARHLRRSSAWIQNRMSELIELTQLDASLLQRVPAELSGGQRQRISLMRALMLDPQVLLLDEPLGALDPVVRYQLQEELKQLFSRLGKTVLLVTHDLAEATFFSDDIALMQSGRIVQRGTYQSLATTPASAFVSEFLRAQRRLPG